MRPLLLTAPLLWLDWIMPRPSSTVRYPAFVSRRAVAVTDSFEECCRLINARRPGEPFDGRHRLLPLAVRMLEESPLAALFVQRGWCLAPDDANRKALGRIRVDVRPRQGLAPARRGGQRRVPPKGAGATAEDEDEADTLTVYPFVPANAYQLFMHEEAQRLRSERTSTLDLDDWAAIGAAWQALTTDRRAEYEQKLHSSPQFRNARVLSTRCAYGCPGGAAGLAHCAGCAVLDASGHPECYLQRLLQSSPDDACEAVYLCPSCLQAHLAFVRLAPPSPPSKAVVVAIERLLCGESSEPLSERLQASRKLPERQLRSPSAGAPAATHALLAQCQSDLRVLAEAADLMESRAYANVHSGVSALLLAEHLRGATPSLVKACAVLHDFDKSTGLEPGAKATRRAEMQSLLDVASSRARGKLQVQLALHFEASALDRLLLVFVRDDVCNALQLQLSDLIVIEKQKGDTEEQGDDGDTHGGDAHGNRNKLRRLAESVAGPLPRLRWIGNQEWGREAKKLNRRVSRFLEVPERATSFRSGLYREGSSRPLAKDLAERAPLMREETRRLAETHTMIVIEDNAPLVEISAPGLGETVHANVSQWTATGSIPMDPEGGTLGDGRELSTAVGRHVATSGPLLGVAFPLLRANAESSSHPGLRLPAEFAGVTDATCRWGTSDGTIARLMHPTTGLVSSLTNGEGLTMRTHVPVKEQLSHLLKNKVLQYVSNGVHLYGVLNDTSVAVLPLHVWSFLERAAGGAIGSFVEGPRDGVRAHSLKFYASAWTKDGARMRVATLRIETPEPVNSLAADEQWALAIALAQRTKQKWRPYPDCGQLGDRQRPVLQGDLGTYSVLDGCQLREQKLVAAAAFRSNEEAEAHVRALMMVRALNDQLRPQMHNQFSLLKGLLVRRFKMGSVDTERTMQGFTKFKPSSEGQSFRVKKEVQDRRAQSFINVEVRRFHIYEAQTGGDKVVRDADGELDRNDYHDRLLEMVRSSVTPDAAGRVDEERADMVREVFDVAVPFFTEVDMTRAAITEVPPMMCAFWLAWLQVSLLSLACLASLPFSLAFKEGQRCLKNRSLLSHGTHLI